MRTLTLARLASGLVLSLGFFGCQSFNECSSNSDCGPAKDGSKQYCTQDHICAKGTPGDELCKEVFPPNPPDNAIIVGALVNALPGDDELPLKAFKLGIEQINAKRGAEPPLALRICEISRDPNDPLKAMERLARQDKAVAVVGPSYSGNVFAIQGEVVESGIPIMSESATSPEITSYGSAQGPVDGLFYRVAPSDSQQGPVLARQITPVPAKLDILTVNDPYGASFKSLFINSYGHPINIQRTYEVPTSETDTAGIKAAADQIIADKPDVVVAITNVYSDNVIRALLGLQQTPTVSKIYMTDGAENQTVLNLVNDASSTPPFVYTAAQMNTHLARITGTAPGADRTNQTGTGAYTTFLGEFQNKWGVLPDSSVYAAYAYDAIYAVGIAIGAASAPVTASQVSQLLGHISVDSSTQACSTNASNQIIVGQSNYLAAKNKVATVNSNLVLLGTTGAICFTPHGDRAVGLYDTWKVNTTTKKFDTMTAL